MLRAICDTLDGVGEPGAVVVPLVVDEDLGLVFEAPECAGVDDPLPVALVLRPVGVGSLRVAAAPRLARAGGVGGQAVALELLQEIAVDGSHQSLPSSASYAWDAALRFIRISSLPGSSSMPRVKACSDFLYWCFL